MKYLIRAGYNPQKSYNVDDALFNNITGWNSGNQLYAYGVFNVLYDGTNELVSTYYKCDFDDREIEYINENFDAFILPLADAFRTDWIDYLDAYTKIINKLKIPCIVVGACLRAPYGCDLNDKFPFDESVKKFISAVLNKSSVIGLRGYRSCEYLKKLGFTDGNHYKAIGCPSLYTYGDTVKTNIPPKEIKKLIININPNVSERVNSFIRKTYERVPYSNVVLQENDEFETIYYGLKQKGWPSKEFPYSIIEKLATEDCVRYFYDPQQWYSYVSSFDMSIGTRFHGTVANVLSGIPHVVIPLDSRMQELVEFHGITKIDMNQVDGCLIDYIDKLDFLSYNKRQSNNLMNYIDFLRENKIISVFDGDIDISRGNSPLERKRKSCEQLVNSYNVVDRGEKIIRRKKYFMQRINKNYRKKEYFSFDQ